MPGKLRIQFFDKALSDATDRASFRALSRFGAYVRRRIKSSLRYSKKPSTAGSPPSVHKSGSFTRKKKGATSSQGASPLRELVYFAYDANRKSVVIGPAIFNSSKIGGGQAPRNLEEGGTGPFISDGKRKIGRFKKHPFVGPAFKAELPSAPRLFAGQVK